jgi:DHA2 family multidrug resistance protein
MYDLATRQRLDDLTQVLIGRGIDPTTAQNQALATIDNLVRREAYIMAYNDCFYFIGCALLLSGIAVIFFKKAKPSGGAAAH